MIQEFMIFRQSIIIYNDKNNNYKNNNNQQMCGGAGKGGNCHILKKLSYSVIIKLDPFCDIMHFKFLIYLK